MAPNENEKEKEKEVDNVSYGNKVEQASRFVEERLSGLQPEIGLILGSGLGDLADRIERPIAIDYKDIPYFPVSTVAGHAGRFVAGWLEGRRVVAMQGRFHYYEGYAQRTVVLPVYVMRRLGAASLIATNAAGGMNRSFKAGDLMLIRDHINFTGSNPLIGPNDSRLGVRFPDMSAAYDAEYAALANRLAAGIGGPGDDPLRLREGVYCGISGPSYMTPAELMMLARLGGDAVGMSTVPEVIAARHCGMRVMGISCITDMAVGEELAPLTHEQVMETAERTKPKFISLMRAIVRELPSLPLPHM